VRASVAISNLGTTRRPPGTGWLSLGICSDESWAKCAMIIEVMRIERRAELEKKLVVAGRHHRSCSTSLAMRSNAVGRLRARHAVISLATPSSVG